MWGDRREASPHCLCLEGLAFSFYFHQQQYHSDLEDAHVKPSACSTFTPSTCRRCMLVPISRIGKLSCPLGTDSNPGLPSSKPPAGTDLPQLTRVNESLWRLRATPRAWNEKQAEVQLDFISLPIPRLATPALSSQVPGLKPSNSGNLISRRIIWNS